MELHVIDDDSSEKKAVRQILADMTAAGKDDPFYVVHLEPLIHRYLEWTENLPRVHPYYAMKCNRNDAVVRTLTALGCGLDVATKSEMQHALALGVPQNLLVYSNTCKATSHLLYAKKTGIDLTVFDTEFELLKIKEHFPSARLMVRLRTDDVTAAIPMGQRFGCNEKEAKDLIDRCLDLSLNVTGVAFHVGCGSSDPSAYARAIEKAKNIFDYAEEKGIEFSLLDMGGGFPGSMGDVSIPFTAYANAINNALDRYFPIETGGVDIIAEPGQFFAACSQSVFTNVIGKKVEPESRKATYVLSDGMHGSFRDIVTFQLTPDIEVHGMSPAQVMEAPKPCSLLGPTCDPMDRITDACKMPTLKVGQWLEFKRMGAYTNELFCAFNGFTLPKSVVFVPRRYLPLLRSDDML